MLKGSPMFFARYLRVSVVVATLVASFACSSSDSGGGAAANGTVSFASKCEVPPSCGGDPTGNWRFARGCVEPPPQGFECAEGVSNGRGTMTGTYTFGASGFNYDTDSELRQCGWVDSSGRGNGGGLEIDGNRMILGGTQTFTFCVEGTTLWLYAEGANYPDLHVLRLERDMDAGS
jgi:hypothetical protein